MEAYDKSVRSTHRILKWKGFHIILKVLHTAHHTSHHTLHPIFTPNHAKTIIIHNDEQNFSYYQPSHNAKPYDQSLTTH